MGSMTPFLGILAAVLGPIGVSKPLTTARTIVVTSIAGCHCQCSRLIRPEHYGRCNRDPSNRSIPCHRSEIHRVRIDRGFIYSDGLISRVQRAGDIAQWTQNYLQATYPSLEEAYQNTIGNASAVSWTSTEFGNKPIMAGGEWLTKPYTSTFANTMLDNFDKIVTFKMIK